MADWLKTAVLVIRIIIEYGPTMYRVGREIYEKVEKWAEEKQKMESIKPSSASKASVFDVALSGRAQHLSRPQRDRLREMIWRSRNPQKADA